MNEKDNIIVSSIPLIEEYVNKEYSDRNDKDDLISAGIEGLINAVNKYNQDTYSEPLVRAIVSLYIFKYVKEYEENSIGSPLNNSILSRFDLENYVINKNTLSIVENAINSLPVPQRDVLVSYLKNDSNANSDVLQMCYRYCTNTNDIHNLIKKSLDVVRQEILFYNLRNNKDNNDITYKYPYNKVTIYDYFFPYSMDEVNDALEQLDMGDVIVLLEVFGSELDEPFTNEELQGEIANEFFKTKYKMCNLLRKISEEKRRYLYK